MSKYTVQAHEERREQIQELRNILMASPELIEANTSAAKTIGRLSIQMPTCKKHFVSINIDVDYLMHAGVTDLVDDDLRHRWMTACAKLKG